MEPPLGSLLLGKFGTEIADEVVLSVKEVVPEPWIEIYCHGGPEVVRLLQDELKACGLTAYSWQEFLQRTSRNTFQGEAAVQLARASTQRTAAILLDQYQGAFEETIRTLSEAWEKGKAEEVSSIVRRLVRFTELGRHLVEPWKVVLAGAPNVGKSSLMNALAGFPRCVVSEMPGTTRDVVTLRVAIDGWPIELCDTAGQRAEAAQLEAEGIRWAQEEMNRADLCLWVLDGTAPPVLPESMSKSLHLLINKIDLPAAWDRSVYPDVTAVSAVSREGLNELCSRISNWLVPDPPRPGDAVPFTSALCLALEELWSHIQADRRDEAGKLLQRLFEGVQAAS